MGNPANKIESVIKLNMSFLLLMCYSILLLMNIAFFKYEFLYDKLLYKFLYLIITTQLLDGFFSICSINTKYVVCLFHLSLIIISLFLFPLIISVPLVLLNLYLGQDIIYYIYYNLDCFKKLIKRI